MNRPSAPSLVAGVRSADQLDREIPVMPCAAVHDFRSDPTDDHVVGRSPCSRDDPLTGRENSRSFDVAVTMQPCERDSELLRRHFSGRHGLLASDKVLVAIR
jgi:hypothetical protein